MEAGEEVLRAIQKYNKRLRGTAFEDENKKGGCYYYALVQRGCHVVGEISKLAGCTLLSLAASRFMATFLQREVVIYTSFACTYNPKVFASSRTTKPCAPFRQDSNLEGTLIQVLDDDTLEDKDCSCSYFLLSRKHQEELAYVGEEEMKANGVETVQSPKGSVLAMAPNLHHEVWLGTEGRTVLVYFFTVTIAKAGELDKYEMWLDDDAKKILLQARLKDNKKRKK